MKRDLVNGPARHERIGRPPGSGGCLDFAAKAVIVGLGLVSVVLVVTQ